MFSGTFEKNNYEKFALNENRKVMNDSQINYPTIV